MSNEVAALTREWTTEEQAKHRKLWVEALRSGKYSQTTEVLRDSRGFCCLGVACEISGLGHWNNYGEYVTEEGENDGELTTSDVRDWLGITSQDGTFISTENEDTSLALLNDEGDTFAQIADVIESAPKGLFK